MKSKLLYPLGLNEFLKSNNYIAKRLKQGERLKKYHRYWCLYQKMYFKVLDIYEVDGVEYYSIRYSNSFSAEIPYPIDDYIFELLVDYSNIKSKNIIDSHISLSGAEIRYWFFANNIDLASKKYSNFWGFLDQNSKSKISDEKYYIIYSTIENNVYKDVKISLDKFRR